MSLSTLLDSLSDSDGLGALLAELVEGARELFEAATDGDGLEAAEALNSFDELSQALVFVAELGLVQKRPWVRASLRAAAAAVQSFHDDLAAEVQATQAGA